MRVMIVFDLLIGAVTSLALPPVYFLPALAVGLLYLYRCSEDSGSLWQLGLHGFLFGMGFHTAALSWLTNAILTRVHEYWWAVPIAAPGCALILAPFIAVPLMLSRLAPPGLARMVLLAAFWTLADMSRVFIFSGFPWNPTGSVFELPGLFGDILIQPASVIGVDGLSFVAVMVGLLVWYGARTRICLLVLFLIWMGVGYYRLTHPAFLETTNPVVALLQGNNREQDILSREGAINAFRRYLALTRDGVEKARLQEPDRSVVYIWPESAFPGLLDEDEAARHLIAQAADGSWGLVGSDRRDSGNRFFNSVMALDETGTVRATYDKSTLVPFGEYQPRFIPFNLLPDQLTPGKGIQTWVLPALNSVVPMVCYEIIFSGQVVAKPRPHWIANVTNDAWFGNSAGPRQHLATARMRAVEEGVPVVQSANMGITAGFNSFGQEISYLPWGKSDALILSIPRPIHETIFSQFGRFVPFCLSLFSIMMVFLLGRRGRQIIKG